MPKKRRLIVNADDFGHSREVNQGILHAYDYGIVTSASLMVRGRAAAEAVQSAKIRPNLSLGLHLDFGEWYFRTGEWAVVYSVVPLNSARVIRDEVLRQLDAFQRLTGRAPSHVDSHQHVHLREPAHSAVSDITRSLNIPLRDCNGRVHYCGRFYGQSAEGNPWPRYITEGALVAVLKELRPGYTELGCHPGRGRIPNTTYVSERSEEVRTLCSQRVRSAITELRIELCSFTEVPGQ